MTPKSSQKGGVEGEQKRLEKRSRKGIDLRTDFGRFWVRLGGSLGGLGATILGSKLGSIFDQNSGPLRVLKSRLRGIPRRDPRGP